MNTRRDFITKAALASAATLAAFAGVQQLASAQGGAGDARRAPRKAYPAVVLRDQDNQPLQFYEEIIRDRVVVINMAYA